MVQSGQRRPAGRGDGGGRRLAVIHVLSRRLVEIGGLGEILARQGLVGALGGGRCGRGLFGVGGHLRRRIVTLQQRIALQLGLAILGQLDIGQLQQLDRLLQLRRHDQRLALTDFEFLPQRHDQLKA